MYLICIDMIDRYAEMCEGFNLRRRKNKNVLLELLDSRFYLALGSTLATRINISPSYQRLNPSRAVT
jgi:hypothetical protein